MELVLRLFLAPYSTVYLQSKGGRRGPLTAGSQKAQPILRAAAPGTAMKGPQVPLDSTAEPLGLRPSEYDLGKTSTRGSISTLDFANSFGNAIFAL